MNNMRYKILVVDDEKEYRDVLSLILTKRGYKIITAANGKEGLEKIYKEPVDLVITDLRMPIMDGNTFIKELKKRYSNVQIIALTAYGSIESAVDSMKDGAVDYFVKSNDMEELIMKIDHYKNYSTLRAENSILKVKVKHPEFIFDTKNKNLGDLIDTCNKIANTNLNVLILGESGVGKEVFAKYIHDISNRSKHNFVAVNCQAYPLGVIESELFGHRKGAFTGAIENRIGKFELANEGTLFLDEIGDLPMEMQGKLLRVLETRTIERIGSNDSIKLNDRFIFATNKDLRESISEGKFREDLLYRINTITIEIPPLRERKEDLASLAKFFMERISKDLHIEYVPLDDSLIEKLGRYDFPGNIRELKNIIERMVVLCSDMDSYCKFIDNIINKDMEQGGGPYTNCSMGVYDSERTSLKEARESFERAYITRVLEENNFVVSRTANELDMSTRQLWNKITKYNIKLR